MYRFSTNVDLDVDQRERYLGNIDQKLRQGIRMHVLSIWGWLGQRVWLVALHTRHHVQETTSFCHFFEMNDL